MLVECRECGGLVSDSAEICPHCGGDMYIQIGQRRIENAR